MGLCSARLASFRGVGGDVSLVEHLLHRHCRYSLLPAGRVEEELRKQCYHFAADDGRNDRRRYGDDYHHRRQSDDAVVRAER